LAAVLKYFPKLPLHKYQCRHAQELLIVASSFGVAPILFSYVQASTRERSKRMKTIFMKVAVGAVASALLGGIAVAQNIEEVTVQGTRMVTAKVVGRTYSGVPIEDVSLSYGVSIAGLDLASPAGFMEAEKRVNEVAEAACKDLVKRYPSGTPSEAECTKAAAGKAMVKVNELAAATSKASAK